MSTHVISVLARGRQYIELESGAARGQGQVSSVAPEVRGTCGVTEVGVREVDDVTGAQERLSVGALGGCWKRNSL